MKRIVIYQIAIILLVLNSCNNDKANEIILTKRSKNYFAKKVIDTSGFKSDYYTVSNEKVGYKHYVLKYYKVIKKDSVTIWFTMDDNSDIFIEENENFYKYNKNPKH